jgi:oxygen-independent coproporphyrinogen-3 oxidase
VFGRETGGRTVTSSLNVLPSQPDETTVGNYFVANYPPFSFWEPERSEEVREALSRPPTPATPLGVYIHIPFCRQRCHFCYFRVYTGAEATHEQVDRYLDRLLDEVDMYGPQPLIAGRRPRYVYFGGGTPSILRPEQMTKLVRGIQARLPWDDAEEITFECEPGTLHPRKLETLRELGISRISLGIENFSDEVLSANNRGHLETHALKAYGWARQLDFPQINIDLIAGMVNETDENWEECVRKTIELAPDCVTIYQMEVTFNSIIYQKMKQRGEVTAPVADWPTKRAWVRRAFEALEAAGYTVTSGCTAVKDPENYRFLYRDYLWRGADMVSLGVSSFGHFGGTHYQNEQHMGPYLERVGRGELPIYRALTMTAEEKLLREAILQLKLGYLDKEYFRQKFDTNILERFAEPLERLERERLIEVGADGVRLTRDGLLQVDSLLPAFFLPQHRHARYT